MNTFALVYELYHTNTDTRILHQSVKGARIGRVLKHVANVMHGQEQVSGAGKVSLAVLGARIGSKTIVEQTNSLESLTTLVTMAVEHYKQGIGGSLIVETVFDNRAETRLIEHMKKVLSSPRKILKLAASLQELDLPSLEKGDVLLVGKFKNRAAVITDFSTDEKGQPVAKTTKGDQKIFKPRIAKLLPGAQPKKQSDDAEEPLIKD